ncbi:MAG: NADH-quinone oxidoreductase subunit C [Deltaproteobacteria bacterium]
MDGSSIISQIKRALPDFAALGVTRDHPDEVCLEVTREAFRSVCLVLHRALLSPVMTLFALDERPEKGVFTLKAVFLDAKGSRWVIVSTGIAQEAPSFDSLAKGIHSASLFEREIREMFGIEPTGHPDPRRLHLHDEVWPQDNPPLRRDFQGTRPGSLLEYRFNRVEGEGICEVPVGPVHAGIIGPGHFRFSVAGEPIINLEIRLGFTHRGVEKLFEGRTCSEAVRLAERVCGDSSFAHSLAFARAAEKISGAEVPDQASYRRAIFLELERMYNHVHDIGGIAVDVGFSFPAAYASVMKETLLRLNERLTGSRYLKHVNAPGGVAAALDAAGRGALLGTLKGLRRDLKELAGMLNGSISFMDRVDTTGILRRKTAEDLGVVGLAGRASGIRMDLREHFPGVYAQAGFRMAAQESGDVLARLRVRIEEFEESCRLIQEFARRLSWGEPLRAEAPPRQGSALGYAEGCRGPVLYWLKTDPQGRIARCKITDPSFRNWQGLSYAVLGDIIPDFPLCNKSFDLSYAGNDL